MLRSSFLEAEEARRIASIVRRSVREDGLPRKTWAEFVAFWNRYIEAIGPEGREHARRKFMHTVTLHRSGCWIRRGRSGPRRYVSFVFRGGEQLHSHKAAWLLFRGPVNDGNPLVLHKCAVRSCVNPFEHLYLGTATDNIADAIRMGGGRLVVPTWTQSDAAVRRFLASPPPRWLVDDRR